MRSATLIPCREFLATVSWQCKKESIEYKEQKKIVALTGELSVHGRAARGSGEATAS
jgi:hypothetical protein